MMDALSASMALPILFDPVEVGPEYAAEEFCGGGYGFNNPTRELLKEARSVYGGDRQLAVIVSIGSGRPKILSLEGSNQESGAMEELLRKLTLNCEMIEKDVSYQLNDVGVYMRLNVDQGLEDVRMHDWNQLGKVTSHTKQYLQSTSVTKLLGTVTEFLLEKQGIMSLNQLCECLRYKTFISLFNLLIPSPRKEDQ
jgi:hypothetical protein